MKRLLITFCCSTLVYTLLNAAHAEDLHIRIPQTSGMHLYSPDQYTSLVSFSGEVQLQGQLLLRSQRKAIDYAAPGIPSAFEWHVALFFQPEPAERNKLPEVRYTDEDKTQTALLIELNSFQKDQIPGVIESIFGADIAVKAGKHAFEVGKRGNLRLKSYRTGIECDRRYHYAELVAFESQQALSVTQVRELPEPMPGGCG